EAAAGEDPGIWQSRVIEHAARHPGQAGQVPGIQAHPHRPRQPQPLRHLDSGPHVLPAVVRPERRAASTLLVAEKPAIAEARATARPASIPWARRKAKSTSRAAPAASTHLAAFVATLVWNVMWLSSTVSASCASAIGAVTSSSGYRRTRRSPRAQPARHR